MSGADETVSVTLPSEYVPSTIEMLMGNEPCWCAECGWSGVEDELMFTNEGVFVCPQCGGDDTDYYYTEEAENCVFCGSDDVVGVIDIVSLNEIHEATPLDKEQVYGYCARCADVKMAESRFDKLSKEIADEYEEKGMSPEEAEKIGDATAAKIGRAKYGKKKFDKMAEGSTGDQIVSWEDGAGVSSPSMPPADIFWSETKKERIASGRAMHYAIPSEKKYPIWDKAHARMALAWSRGTKYADKVEKAVSKRFPSMGAESWAAEFAALGEPDAPYDQGYDDQQDESLGERHPGPHEQSLKDRRDEADAMDKKTGRKYHDVGTMDKGKVCAKCGTYGYWGDTSGSEGGIGSGSGKYCPVCSGMVPGIDMDDLKKQVRDKTGLGSESSDWVEDRRSYNNPTPDTLAERKAAHQKWLKDRREWAMTPRGQLETAFEHSELTPVYDEDIKYDVLEIVKNHYTPNPVSTTKASEHHKGQGYDDEMDESLGMRNRVTHEQSFKDRRDEAAAMDKEHTRMGRKYDDVAAMDSEHHKGQGYDDELDESLGMSHKESGMKQSFKDRRDESKGTEKFDHSRAYSRVKAMDAENMGLTQYVGSAGGSGDGTPVSYGGIALPESDVAAMVESSTSNPMDASPLEQ